MNQFKKIKIGLLACAALGCGALQAATQIGMTTAAPAADSFTTNILAKAFDRMTGTFYVGTTGLNAGNTHGVASAARDAGFFTPLAARSATGVDAATIALIGSPATRVVAQSAGATGAATAFEIIDPAGVAAVVTRNQGGAAAGNIVGSNPVVAAANHFSHLTGSPENVFMVVHAGAGATSAQHSGILAFDALGTRVNGAGVVAAKLDDRVQGAAATDGQFLLNGSASANLATAPTINDLYWDSDLGALFVAASVTTANAADFHTAISKVVINAGVLETQTVLGANISGADNNTETIFSTDCTTARNDPRIYKIRTMHTSTDRRYLIVNGGIANDDTTVGNQFYCLQFNSTTGFVTQNDNAKTVLADNFIRTGGGAGQSLDGGNVGSLFIGAGNAPWAANQGGATDMEVVGDTVYVSNGNPGRDQNNDPGIWSSRALFNHQGVIIGWTPWERVFTAINTDRADAAQFFAVDGKAGLLWQVNDIPTANEEKVVRRTGMTTTAPAAAGPGLAARLNFDLADSGCTAVLDLPKGTPGINGQVRGGGAANIHNSFTLFGGNEKVIFARTRSGLAAAPVITQTFVPAADYLSTSISGAGYVRALGYSRHPNAGAVATQGYFFAGTDNGLYVFASDAANPVGFDNNTASALYGLGSLDVTVVAAAAGETAIRGFKWTRMAATGDNAITGAVTAIESNGTHLFVVEQDLTNKGSIVSKLHRFTIANDVATMAPAVLGTHIIIAQSGVGDIPADAIFTGFAILSDSTGDRLHTFGVLATNRGAYRSLGAGRYLHNFDPAQDAWAPITDATGALTGMFANKRGGAANHDGVALNVTGVSLADDGKNYYQHSTFGILGTTWAANAITDVDIHNYTNATVAAGGTVIPRFDRTLSFWTDGGRRFFTRFNATESDWLTLESMPFYAGEWNMSASNNLSTTRIHCIENISGLGIVVMGTDTGVITIE